MGNGKKIINPLRMYLDPEQISGKGTSSYSGYQFPEKRKKIYAVYKMVEIH